MTYDRSLALTASHPEGQQTLFCSLLVFEWMLLIMVEMTEVLMDRPGLMKMSNLDGLDIL